MSDKFDSVELQGLTKVIKKELANTNSICLKANHITVGRGCNCLSAHTRDYANNYRKVDLTLEKLCAKIYFSKELSDDAERFASFIPQKLVEAFTYCLDDKIFQEIIKSSEKKLSFTFNRAICKMWREWIANHSVKNKPVWYMSQLAYSKIFGNKSAINKKMGAEAYWMKEGQLVSSRPLDAAPDYANYADILCGCPICIVTLLNDYDIILGNPKDVNLVLKNELADSIVNEIQLIEDELSDEEPNSYILRAVVRNAMYVDSKVFQHVQVLNFKDVMRRTLRAIKGLFKK